MAEGENNGGNRAVTNVDLQRELRVLNAELNGKLDLVIQKADYAEKAQEALRLDVNKNAAEILNLRQRAHDNANGIQALELRTAPLSLALSTEIVGGMSEIRRGMEFIRASDVVLPFKQAEIDAMRDLMANRRKREQKWFGLPREIVGGVLVLLLFLIVTTLWSYIRQKLGLP